MATTFDQTAKNKKARNLPRFSIEKKKSAINFIAWNQQGARAEALDDSRTSEVVVRGVITRTILPVSGLIDFIHEFYGRTRLFDPT
jgi:hypothetical protein